eukprot:comp23434_c2_seq1/m.39022 comp23434_c2_seq1/g.39022  ORF comp23434_c2_seq1/g.39022 comp23434_c2_seq1/m.39022 type:complete len:115 (-) comp23434_c2_seq1:2008-2352(-)
MPLACPDLRQRATAALTRLVRGARWRVDKHTHSGNRPERTQEHTAQEKKLKGDIEGAAQEKRRPQFAVPWSLWVCGHCCRCISLHGPLSSLRQRVLPARLSWHMGCAIWIWSLP